MTRRRAVPIKRDPITWILVADGKQAHVYTRAMREKRVPTGSGAMHRHYDESSVQELALVPGMVWKAESAAIYETGPHRLGRIQESASSAHHMGEPHIDIHNEVKLHFIQAIAARLNEACVQKSFDKLVLIAPPKMLGELREFLAPAVAKRVVAEMPKDLTHCEGKELAEHLNNIA